MDRFPLYSTGLRPPLGATAQKEDKRLFWPRGAAKHVETAKNEKVYWTYGPTDRRTDPLIQVL